MRQFVPEALVKDRKVEVGVDCANHKLISVVAQLGIPVGFDVTCIQTTHEIEKRYASHQPGEVRMLPRLFILPQADANISLETVELWL